MLYLLINIGLSKNTESIKHVLMKDLFDGTSKKY